MSAEGKPTVLQLCKFYGPGFVGGIEATAGLYERMLAPRFRVQTLTTRRGPGRRQAWQSHGGVFWSGSMFGYQGQPIAPLFPVEVARQASNANVIACHAPFPLSNVGLSLARASTKAPPVVTIFHADVAQSRWNRRGAVLAQLEERLLGASAAIIVSSEALRDNSPTLAGFRSKTRVVPLTIDLASVPRIPIERARALRNAAGIPHDATVILFVGRLAYYKGLEHLLHAASGMDVYVVIVGDGPERARLQEIARKSGMGGRAVFAGFLAETDLHTWYAACDIFCLPSTTAAEAFGVVQLEAMAHGLPVVNTSLSTGVPTVSIAGITGMTVPPGDSASLRSSLEALVDDAELRHQLGRAGARRVADFSTTKHATKLRLVFEEALELGR